MKYRIAALALLLLPGWAAAADTRSDLRGYFEGELLYFPRDAKFPEQHGTYLSVAAEPEYLRQWNGRDDLFTFKPFYRLAQHDSNRTHGDIRELSWLHAAYSWELTLGFSKVFWGVTESIHLVDIINQTDLVENLDGEDKLGQPMAKLALIRDWGVLNLFVLPYFRERTFQSRDGRPRFGIPVDTGEVLYESSAEQKHIDFAARWSHYFGDWDIGIAHFRGTSREPRFVILPKNVSPATLQPKWVNPLYEQINQTSLDVQATKGDWLWKLEAYSRSGQGKRYTAAAGGFEYTIVGIHESRLDLGIIMEYLYDGRDDEFDISSVQPDTPFSATIFDDDVVLGTRLTFNDIQSSELLASLTFDTDGDGIFYNVEASTRLGESWKLAMELRGVHHVKDGTVEASFDKDDRLRLQLTRYF
jgi:hypothetical protein